MKTRTETVDSAPHPLTRNQYTAARAERVWTEYPHLDRADRADRADVLSIAIQDAESNSPDGWWFGTVEPFARAGGVFRALWLHTLGQGHYILVSKHHPASLPAGYVRR